MLAINECKASISHNSNDETQIGNKIQIKSCRVESKHRRMESTEPCFYRRIPTKSISSNLPNI